jgi:hypothetical protein
MDTYEIGTSDIYLAAAYMALGAKYTRADKSNSRHMTFYFVPPESENEEEFLTFSFQKIESNWVNRTLLVNAQRYKEAIQTLKGVVHTR